MRAFKNEAESHHQRGVGARKTRAFSLRFVFKNVLAFCIVFCIVFGTALTCLFAYSANSASGKTEDGAMPSNAPSYDVKGASAQRAYEVSDDVFEIDSLSDLLIAAYCYGLTDGTSHSGAVSVPLAAYDNFKLTDNILCIYQPSDIEALDSAFGKDGWGRGDGEGRALTNVAVGKVGNALTIFDSLFFDFIGTFDGNGYVINGFTLIGGAIGGDGENAGFFGTIGVGAVVKDMHLRNVNFISVGVKNVGALAGTALSDLTNVTVQGIFNVSEGTNAGGIVGVLGRYAASPSESANAKLSKAIALGEIYANNVTSVGGVVGNTSSGAGSVDNAVTVVTIWATGSVRLVGGVIGGGNVGNKCFYIANSLWKNSVCETSSNDMATQLESYSNLYKASASGYGGSGQYYLSTSAKSTLDMADDHYLDVASADASEAPRESKRLGDIIDVYLLQYSLTKTTATVGGKTFAVYARSDKSLLVGSAKGTDSSPFIISNRQSVTLFREFRFATFKLIANVRLGEDDLRTFKGAFYGKIFNDKSGANAYDANGYRVFVKGYDGSPMFEAVESANGIPLESY